MSQEAMTFVLPLEHIQWLPCGSKEPHQRLRFVLQIGEMCLHIEAIEVTMTGEGPVAADPSMQTELDGLQDAAGYPFSTLLVGSKQYTIIGLPFAA